MTLVLFFTPAVMSCIIILFKIILKITKAKEMYFPVFYRAHETFFNGFFNMEADTRCCFYWL